MNRFEVTVNLAEGLHTRPASEIADICAEVNGRLVSQNGEADLSSILSLMTLGVQKGEIVFIELEVDSKPDLIESIRNILEG